MLSETQPPSVNTVEDAPVQPTAEEAHNSSKPTNTHSSPSIEQVVAGIEKLFSVLNAQEVKLRELDDNILLLKLLKQQVETFERRLDLQQRILDVAAESVGQLVSDMNQIKRDKARNKRKHQQHQNQFSKISPSQG